MARGYQGARHVGGPRFGGDARTAAALNKMSRRVDDVVRQAFTFDDSRKNRGGGKGTEIKRVQVTGYAASNTKFKVRDLDADGAMVGSEYQVYAMSYGSTIGAFGTQGLLVCLPLVQVNDKLMIWKVQWTAAIKDWVAVPTFVASCAPPAANANASDDSGGSGAAIPLSSPCVGCEGELLG